MFIRCGRTLLGESFELILIEREALTQGNGALRERESEGSQR